MSLISGAVLSPSALVGIDKILVIVFTHHKFAQTTFALVLVPCGLLCCPPVSRQISPQPFRILRDGRCDDA